MLKVELNKIIIIFYLYRTSRAIQLRKAMAFVLSPPSLLLVDYPI
jgi:hypothetical protein